MKRAFAVLFVLACQPPPSTQSDAAAPATTSSACTRIGATCTFAPGKLGTCVEVEPTSGPATLVCQSQH